MMMENQTARKSLIFELGSEQIKNLDRQRIREMDSTPVFSFRFDFQVKG